MVRIMELVAASWKDVATALGFNGPRINCLEADARHVSEDATREMFIKWLDGEHDLRQPIRWTTLIQCLSEAGLAGVAERIRSACLNKRHVNTLIVA